MTDRLGKTRPLAKKKEKEENIWPAEEKGKGGKYLEKEKILPAEAKTTQQEKQENVWIRRTLVNGGEKRRRRNIFGDRKNDDRQMDRISSCSKKLFLAG